MDGTVSVAICNAILFTVVSRSWSARELAPIFEQLGLFRPSWHLNSTAALRYSALCGAFPSISWIEVFKIDLQRMLDILKRNYI